MKNIITLTLCLIVIAQPALAADWGLQSASASDWGLLSSSSDGLDVAYFPEAPADEPDDVGSEEQQAVPAPPAVQQFTPEVRLYSASWCPACKTQKKILDAAGIKYRERDGNSLRSIPQVYISTPTGQWRRFTKVVSAASVQAEIDRQTIKDSGSIDNLPPGEQPTSIDEVRRVLAILKPSSSETFVDYGCGDGRWIIEAAKRYGCSGVGVEINPQRAALARRKVDEAGLSGRVKIITGDARTANVNADVGVAYLWPDMLDELRPKLLALDRFVSYMHPVKSVQMTNYDRAYYWRKPQPVQQQRRYATWNGRQYSGPVCNDPRCGMCNSIRRQLGM